MKLMHFHTLRSGVQINASPATEQALVAMETDLRDALGDSGLFDSVEVEHTDDPDQLVIALCKFLPFFTEDDVARHLERIWGDRVSYPFWEAHAFHVENGHVEFEAATRHSSAGHYVTVHLVAQKASIPVQRAGGSA